MQAELFARLREERKEAWTRAEIFARYSDTLEKSMAKIIEAPAGMDSDFICSLLRDTLTKAQAQFDAEWSAYKGTSNAE